MRGLRGPIVLLNIKKNVMHVGIREHSKDYIKKLRPKRSDINKINYCRKRFLKKIVCFFILNMCNICAFWAELFFVFPGSCY